MELLAWSALTALNVIITTLLLANKHEQSAFVTAFIWVIIGSLWGASLLDRVRAKARSKEVTRDIPEV